MADDEDHNNDYFFYRTQRERLAYNRNSKWGKEGGKL